MADQPTEPHLHLDQRDAVLVLTMHRPAKRNAITKQMMSEIIAALDDAGQDRSTKAVIVRGDGLVFSAGWDRVELLDHSEPGRSEYVSIALAFYRAMLNFPKPLIAAVEGYALGTAFDVALLCDVRVCADDATFAHPEVKLGGPCLYTPVKEAVGSTWARYLCLSGDPIDAATAADIGFVLRTTAPGSALQTALDVASGMCDVPVETLEYTKSYLLSSPHHEQWLTAELDYIMTHGMTIQR